jgi:predicted unusual protein kinase regulating ubiquinone biosynthesis (AarF/ABC1/UbiB family)
MKKINKIKSKFLSRQISIAKLAVKTGATLYKNKDKDLKEQLKSGFDKYANDIVSELGVMKGSFMKAGQLLSLLGGSFLPKETQKILKALENSSSYLAWDKMKEQVPYEWLNELDINEEPIAAASLGQVHRVKEKETGKEFILKIQYKGVDKAIKNDIRALKLFLKTLNLIPKELDLSSIYIEVETMLRREVNYIEEAQSIKRFQKYLNEFSDFKIPEVIEKYSNKNIIALEYLEGFSLHQIDELQFNQEERNKLGRSFMKLLFMELFLFEEIQTDSHFGNYLILKDPKPRWGLLDFGAIKTPPKSFIKPYRQLIIDLSKKDKDSFINSLKEMGYLSKEKESDLSLFWEYANVIGAPFYEKEYDWGKSNISDKMYEYIPKIAKSISIGNPPPHSLFIDRKIAGVYFILQKLEAQFDVNELLEEVLDFKD